MTAEQDIDDLQHHADEMERHESFNYAILPADETELFGCIYIDPIPTEDDQQIEAEVSWWVTPTAPDWLRQRLGDLATAWIHDAWPFTHIHTPFNPPSSAVSVAAGSVSPGELQSLPTDRTQGSGGG